MLIQLTLKICSALLTRYSIPLFTFFFFHILRPHTARTHCLWWISKKVIPIETHNDITLWMAINVSNRKQNTNLSRQWKPLVLRPHAFALTVPIWMEILRKHCPICFDEIIVQHICISILQLCKFNQILMGKTLWFDYLKISKTNANSVDIQDWNIFQLSTWMNWRKYICLSCWTNGEQFHCRATLTGRKRQRARDKETERHRREH